MILWLQVENNSKFVRGKGKSRQYIEDYCLSEYRAKKLGKDGWEYELTFQYEHDEYLENQMEALAVEMNREADSRNGFIEYYQAFSNIPKPLLSTRLSIFRAIPLGFLVPLSH